MTAPHEPSIASFGPRLAGKTGPQYWRSLEELAGSDAFRAALEREFPAGASLWDETVSRRRFLELMAASLALAGVTGCTRQPTEKILPYVRQPEELVPGKPLYFATSLERGGFATGVLVESHMGRPTKVEGNPSHPASLGATDAFCQAEVLSLYDPDRSQVVTHLQAIRSWDTFIEELRANLAAAKAVAGRGMRILTETVTSPAVAAQLEALLAEYPEARWHQWEPVDRDAELDGANRAFGRAVETRYVFERADVIVSLDADFLFDVPGSVRYARDFASRRLPAGERPMSRLHAAESTPTTTGAMADARIGLRAAEIAATARAIALRLGVGGESTEEDGRNAAAGRLGARADAWVRAVVADLEAHRGRSVVLAGRTQPPAVHALAHAINAALGNAGETVVYTEPVVARPTAQNESLRELVEDLRAGRVTMLMALGGDPVHSAPADLELGELLVRVPFTVHLGLYQDATSAHCKWHLPEAHGLEAWGDGRAYDGTVTLRQPLIAPLYSGRSLLEVLAVLRGAPRPSGYEVLRTFWRERRGEEGFEEFWRRSVHDGVVAESELPAIRPELRAEAASEAIAESAESAEARSPGEAGSAPLELVFRPDPAVWDGRYANNGWLQELPRPLSKLTWDNVATVGPAMAERLALASGDVVELSLGERTVEAPVWIQPGQPDGTVAVTLGYGHETHGRVARGVGFNAARLRSSSAPWVASGLSLQKTGARHALAATQEHHSMEGRHLVRKATLAEFVEHPDFAHELGHDPPADLTLFPERPYEGYRWGMAIDLNVCTGCSACVVACQAENNIPVVGKEEVGRGREMHWIRVDRYYEGEPEAPATVHQPVLCMHCENAPCEVVCPVAATVHSDEGLNDMVYNRCVGTRYCSNNCPYKVRRFNFFQYADRETPSLKLGRNPDVTVRSRGVMEKCTYCVQRINVARIEAKKEGRRLRDGEIVTACQGVCPTRAIVFGDLNDPESEVSRRKADGRNYGILTELNTRPRTTYLARVENPAGGGDPAPREEGD